VRDAFFENLEPPRLESATAITKAIARGVSERVVAYTSGSVPSLGGDGRFQIARDKVTLGPLAEDEVDLDSGFLMVPASLPDETPAPGGPTSAQPQPTGDPSGAAVGPDETPVPIPPGAGSTGSTKDVRRTVQVAFTATRDQVFKAFP